MNTRRNFIRHLSATGIGLAAVSLTPRLLFAQTRMQGEIFFEPYVPAALQRALEYAGESGFVASLPQLLHARANAPFDNIIWNTWFTSYTEENVLTTPQGNLVVVVVHGGGIFGSPDRLETTHRSSVAESSPVGLTGKYAGKITSVEANDLLQGRLPDGAEVPIYPFSEFKQDVADLPMRYGVVLDFELAKQSKRGYERFDILKDDPNMIARAGGVEPLAAYLDKAQARHNTELMGNWHPYNRINPDQPQARIVFLAGNQGGVGSEDDEGPDFGYNSEYGIGGDASIHNMARYVAVAPRDTETTLRDLEFQL